MRTKKILWPAAGVVAVLLAGAGIAIATRGGSEKPATTAAPGPVTSSAATVPTSPPPPPGADITGPLNLLLIGVDTRVSIPDWQPHADTIMLLHIDEGLKSGYLYSLPRDLRVDVPAYAKNGYGGGRHKLTEAMSYGSEINGTDRANVSNGYELLSQAVSKYTGIKKFDAGAVLTFNGLSKLTDALGGVTMTIDQKVLSLHRKPDGTARPLRPGGGGYLGPQAAYLPGTRTLVGWQAIDYARQRYGLPNGDYDRQRHQRQLVEALLTKAQSSGLATDQAKLRSVLGALGDTLVFSGDRTPLEYAYALRDLTPARLTSVSLPGASVFNGGYIGEQLTPAGRGFLKAVAGGNPGPYLAKHPELRSK